jgi:anaerobic ribonucleoside-triphosphate reductase
MEQKQIRVPTEIYSRVVGYYRPVNQWNKGKQEEFSERRTYRLPEDFHDFQDE